MPLGPATSIEAIEIDDAQSSFSFTLEDRREERARQIRRCGHGCMKMICLPIMLLLSGVTIVLFFVFCGIPFILCLLLAIGLYYCCTKEPIPPRILVRALLDLEDQAEIVDPNAEEIITKADIQRQLLYRRLVKIYNAGEEVTWDVKGENIRDVSHLYPGVVYLETDTEQLEPRVLLFSEPLTPILSENSEHVTFKDDVEMGGGETKVSEDDDDELDACSQVGTAVVPRYYQHGFSSEFLTTEPEEEENVPDDEKNEDQQAETNTTEVRDLEAQTEDDGDHPDGDENATTGQNSSPAHADSTQDDDDDNDTASEMSQHHGRGTVCDICMIRYEVMDVVAWSRNPACDHCFHPDCLVDWLLRKPTCPACRADYLYKEEDATATDKPGPHTQEPRQQQQSQQQSQQQQSQQQQSQQQSQQQPQQQEPQQAVGINDEESL